MTIQANFPAIKPSLLLDFANTKQLDSRITYTRASTASFYNGVTTAKAEQNLFLQSQTFDTSWLNVNGLTVSSNVSAAPDGTTTADKLVEPAATASFVVRQGSFPAAASETFAFSCFAKPSGRNFIAITHQEGSVSNRWVNAVFDVSTGAVTQSSAGAGGVLVSTAITSAGGGWYRITLISNQSGTANFWRIGPSNTGTPSIGGFGEFSYTGDGTSGVEVWGAQLEQRSAVTAYTATTTQAITNYIPVLQTAASGVARFDNNPTTGESLGLLIEESRSNLVTYSSQFDNAAWTKTASTITADTIVSPDGTLNGEKLVDTATSAIHKIEQTQTVTNGASYTISVFAKAAERSWLIIYEDSGASNYAFFNLTTGALGTVNAGTSTITPVGNGWYRCTLTHTQTIGTSERVRIAVSNANTTFTYTGDGYSGIYIWGVQLEAGAFATSYIPTVASQVTRAADSASMTGTNFSSWYNFGSGTLYGEGIGASSACAIATINTGTSFNNMIVLGSINSTNEATRIYANGSAQAELGTISTNTNIKISLAYATNNIAASLNGATALTDTSAIIPIVGIDTLQIGRQWNSTQQICGTIKKIAYYPIRLSNTNIQALTS
jgi:hypothetical protein